MKEPSEIIDELNRLIRQTAAQPDLAQQANDIKNITISIDFFDKDGH